MKDVIGIVTKSTGSTIVNSDIEISHGVAYPPKGYRLRATVSYLDNGRFIIKKLPEFAVRPEKLIIYGVPDGVNLTWTVEYEKIPSKDTNATAWQS